LEPKIKYLKISNFREMHLHRKGVSDQIEAPRRSFSLVAGIPVPALKGIPDLLKNIKTVK